jgi:hypothetical protein
MHCDSADLAAHNLAFAGMEASSHTEPKRLDTLRYGAGAADCAGGTIECSKESVAGRVYLAAVETGEFAAHKIVVTVKQVVPATIAKRCGPFSGADDVRE